MKYPEILVMEDTDEEGSMDSAIIECLKLWQGEFNEGIGENMHLLREVH